MVSRASMGERASARRIRRAGAGAALLGVVLVLASACATPIGVDRVDHSVVYRSLTRSVLSGDEPSLFTEQFLRRHGLEEKFRDDPEVVLKELHGNGTGFSEETLFALAELSFLHGERAKKPEYHLAAAVYALAFIVSPEWRAAGLTANAIDPRTRMASDFYNLGLVSGLRVPAPPTAAGEPPPPPEVSLNDRTLALPFGELELRTVPETLLWGGYRFSRFISSAVFETRGLRNRYRQAGVGAPLLAEVEPVAAGPDGGKARPRNPPRIQVAVTALVQMRSVIDELASGRIHATVTVHPADGGATVDINGAEVPLELDPTAALGYTLEGAPVWDSEIGGFLRASRDVFGDGLVVMGPCRPGRVPGGMGHGTASGPARRGGVINEIQKDPGLRERVRVWVFMY